MPFPKGRLPKLQVRRSGWPCGWPNSRHGIIHGALRRARRARGCREGSILGRPPLDGDGRFDVPDDFELALQEAENVIFLVTDGDDFDDGSAALGDNDRLSRGVNLLHYRETAGFKSSGGDALHALYLLTMVILTRLYWRNAPTES